jgi:hypothetical protein
MVQSRSGALPRRGRKSACSSPLTGMVIQDGERGGARRREEEKRRGKREN